MEARIGKATRKYLWVRKSKRKRETEGGPGNRSMNLRERRGMVRRSKSKLGRNRDQEDKGLEEKERQEGGAKEGEMRIGTDRKGELRGTWCGVGGGFGRGRERVKRKQIEMWGREAPQELAFREAGRTRKKKRRRKEEAGLT